MGLARHAVRSSVRHHRCLPRDVQWLRHRWRRGPRVRRASHCRIAGWQVLRQGLPHVSDHEPARDGR
eukprot:scaffold7990_cov601-Pinguiococcus_pyrenoidosus.AAC.1